MEDDYETGRTIVDEVIPFSLEYYLGINPENEDEDDFDDVDDGEDGEGDHDIENDDTDEDDDKKKGKKGEKVYTFIDKRLVKSQVTQAKVRRIKMGKIKNPRKVRVKKKLTANNNEFIIINNNIIEMSNTKK